MKKILLPLIALLITGLAFQSCKKAKVVTLTNAINVQGLFSLDTAANWSSLGINSRVAVQLAEDDINKYFADKNLPYSIAINVTDTKLDAATAAAQFTTAKNSGIHFIIGPQSSAELAAIKPLADASEVIVVSQSSTAGSLAVAGDGIFRFCPSDQIEGAASGNTIYNKGIKGLVTVARDDAGNKGLQASVGAAFTAKGGEVNAVTPYAANTTDFTAVIADIKAKVASLTTAHGQGNVAVYLASFDETPELFKAAAAEPSLAAVKWYGGDGIALNAVLTADAAAADFAIQTGFFAPSVGLPAALQTKWQPVADRIKAKTNLDVDAFALAAYDALWAIAYTIEANNGDVSNFDKLKTSFVEQANTHKGISSNAVLDDAGDRASGTFDYYGIRKTGVKYEWYLVGKSDE
ncbi:ABC transporter substrate-binding protein [Mucilaginibacter rigui]|uniref:ABC transporter substrate-binding protein n=1 Tax=Mucilaginibacter rigui TaxID=534635 RepID=A0ABR7X727_9SPHI|nr:ABC transporter substrate-binding protein [Mucilaginibacter rigui]MBD1386367.1 ABC transporter substrate-binding protein [Mucilaginibacter rigui]